MTIWHQFVGYYSTALAKIAAALGFLGGHRWAAAIILITIAIRTLLLPLAIKQIRSMREQQRLNPEVQRLRQKYKGDRQKMTQEMMALYQREGVNPYAACLPMVAQFPVIIAFYQALRKLTFPPKYWPHSTKLFFPHSSQIARVTLAQKYHLVPRMPFLGLGDLAHPASSSAAGWILIGIMTVAQLLATQQLNPGQTDQQKRMQMLMPLFFLVIFIRFPAGLVLYWTTQTLYQLVQQMIMTRDMRKAAGSSGWRGMLPFGSKGATTGRAPRTRPAAPPVAARPLAVTAGPGPDFGSIAARRDLDEKRRRRRRKKRKRKR